MKKLDARPVCCPLRIDSIGGLTIGGDASKKSSMVPRWQHLVAERMILEKDMY